jgi:hypothetical protein
MHAAALDTAITNASLSVFLYSTPTMMNTTGIAAKDAVAWGCN